MFLRSNQFWLKLKSSRRWLRVVLALTALVINLAIVFTSLVNASYQDKLPPNFWINNLNLSNQTKSQALAQINQELKPPEFVELRIATQSARISSHELGLSLPAKAVVERVVERFNHTSDLVKPYWILRALMQPTRIELTPELDRATTTEFLARLEQKLGQPAKPAHIELGQTNQVKTLVIHQSQPGVAIDVEKTLASFSCRETTPTLDVVFAPPPTPLTPTEIEAAKQAASKLVGKSIILLNETEQIKLILNDQDLVEFLNPHGGYFDEIIQTKVEEVAQQLDRLPVEAVFKYDPETLVVAEFQPNKAGLKLNQDKLNQAIKAGLEQVREESSIEVKLEFEVNPAKTKLGDINNLGINQLIGRGESLYYHSIPSRVHNVGLAANKVSNIIIKPGEEFSFNQAVGDVSAKTGYRSAYIIRNGRTEKGDGGGVCQVSTTLFRAVLDAGLKVTRRVPHSYRVSYYELDHKPGIDATVFSGNTDLRFINDTPGHIILRSVNIPEKRYLRYEIYGTDDGRTTEIIDHQTWGYRPPPPPEFIPDPNMPAGVKKQIDWAAAGIKAKFTNVIRDRDGNTIRQDTYTSDYKPWSAKYLVGPGFETSS